MILRIRSFTFYRENWIYYVIVPILILSEYWNPSCLIFRTLKTDRLLLVDSMQSRSFGSRKNSLLWSSKVPNFLWWNIKVKLYIVDNFNQNLALSRVFYFNRFLFTYEAVGWARGLHIKSCESLLILIEENILKQPTRSIFCSRGMVIILVKFYLFVFNVDNDSVWHF